MNHNPTLLTNIPCALVKHAKTPLQKYKPQVPYIVDTAGPIPGIRTHSTHVQANGRGVMMTYELEDGLTIGAVENFLPQHEIVGDSNNAIARLAVVLEWKAPQSLVKVGTGAHMSSPVVRGAPYTSMQYNSATPRLRAQRFASADPTVDGGRATITCGEGFGVFGASVLVTREIRVQFDTRLGLGLELGLGLGLGCRSTPGNIGFRTRRLSSTNPNPNPNPTPPPPP